LPLGSLLALLDDPVKIDFIEAELFIDFDGRNPAMWTFALRAPGVMPRYIAA
jgi:hypothetical protein